MFNYIVYHSKWFDLTKFDAVVVAAAVAAIVAAIVAAAVAVVAPTAARIIFETVL